MTDTKIAENWTEDEVFTTWAAPPDPRPDSDMQDLLQVSVCEHPRWDGPKLHVAVACRYLGQFSDKAMPTAAEALEESAHFVDLGADDVKVLVAVLTRSLALMRSLDSE